MTNIGAAVARFALEPSARTGEVLLWVDTGASLRRLGIGVALSALLGLVCGVLMGALPLVGAGMSPFMAVFAFPAGDPGNKPRSPQKHGDSKLGRLTGFVLAKRLIGESVELSSRNVSFKFSIPNLSVEFDKPLPKFSQFVRRKVLNLTLKHFGFAHASHHYAKV